MWLTRFGMGWVDWWAGKSGVVGALAMAMCRE